MIKNIGVFMGVLLCAVSAPCAARSLNEAPMNIQAALLIKLSVFNQSVNQGGDLVVYAIAAPTFAKTMKPAVGRSIGKSKLVDVVSLDRVPPAAPTGPAILYVGDVDHVEACLAYCKKHHILSVTGVPIVMDKGVSMRLGVENNKPVVLLSTALSKKEGILWDAKVFAIAKDE